MSTIAIIFSLRFQCEGYVAAFSKALCPYLSSYLFTTERIFTFNFPSHFIYFIVTLEGGSVCVFSSCQIQAMAARTFARIFGDRDKHYDEATARHRQSVTVVHRTNAAPSKNVTLSYRYYLLSTAGLVSLRNTFFCSFFYKGFLFFLHLSPVHRQTRFWQYA